jgi:hypothetical protein
MAATGVERTETIRRPGLSAAQSRAHRTPTDTAKRRIGAFGARYGLRLPKRLVYLGLDIAIIWNILALIDTQARQLAPRAATPSPLSDQRADVVDQRASTMLRP